MIVSLIIIFPVAEEKLHINDRKLKGFVWREDEQPKSKDDIYIHDAGDDEIIRLERIKEHEARLQAIKDAEEQKKRELEAKRLQEEQDNVSDETKDLKKEKGSKALKIDKKKPIEKKKGE